MKLHYDLHEQDLTRAEIRFTHLLSVSYDVITGTRIRNWASNLALYS